MKEHAELVQMFLLETDSTQLVKNFTRSEFVQGGVLSRSCIDHCYSNASGKVSTPEVIVVGNSDHLGVVLTKYTRAPKPKPKVVMKRSYKHFKTEDFLNDINSRDINVDVTCESSLEQAATKFKASFKAVLDRHAPIRVFQMRKLFSIPFRGNEASHLSKKLMERTCHQTRIQECGEDCKGTRKRHKEGCS